MNTTSRDAITPLERLIHLCKEASYECSVAAHHVRDPHLRALLEAGVGEHATLARQLEERVSALRDEGGAPALSAAPPSGGWSEMGPAAERDEEAAIVAACEYGERLLLAAYAEVAEDSRLDSRTRGLVQRQAEFIAEAHRRFQDSADRVADQQG